MARRAAEEAENHWPGFVDALSTIVMVVTFLLIILAVAIFVLSQNIAKSYIETHSAKTEQGGGDKMDPDPGSATKEFMGDKKVEAPVPDTATEKMTEAPPPPVPTEPDPTVTPQPQEPVTQPPAPTTSATAPQSLSDTPNENTAPKSPGKTQSKDTFNSQLAEELKGNDDVEEDTDLSILSRKVPIEEKRIVVAPQDKTEQPKASTVQKAQTILVIDFQSASVKMDEAAANEIRKFSQTNSAILKDQKVTVWSFTSPAEGSVSQAKRVAYYRALAARNNLLSSGTPPENIGIEIRFTDEADKTDTVQLVVN
ncbi:conserved hypothetical protein [Roseibium sp. TrichSKD4]|uniref:hypothetical protein n=1 Tax=Roseibium sp. TrichSKD4 TaxID=744980 RepID=UPI0001E5684E|nr:hypothetical protein [Roseibium sp. TrichSKD4]EFO31286.1 conserved hypothetical protein [Roseibium sp. TrichSKD4]